MQFKRTDDVKFTKIVDEPLIKRKRFRSPWFKVLIVVQIVTLVLAGYFFYQYLQEKQKTITSNSTDQSAEVKQLVGKLIKLETDSEPTIATIKDIESLKKENPDFYKDAQNGDILLIFPKRAILYNKDQNIIINVAPIINNTDTTTTPTSTVIPTKTVAPTATNTIKPTTKK